jgi:hypothetical protein
MLVIVESKAREGVKPSQVKKKQGEEGEEEKKDSTHSNGFRCVVSQWLVSAGNFGWWLEGFVCDLTFGHDDELARA